MRLEEVVIGKYKHLTNIKVTFQNLDLDNSIPLKLFIGKNGSGKSAMMEAIGLIFTRIIQDESPGFPFKIQYKVWNSGKWISVKVETGRSPKQISVWEGEKKIDLKSNPFSRLVHLHPRRIIAQSSGPTSLLDDILIETPIDALKSDIFDAATSPDYNFDLNQRVAEIQNSIQKLRRIYSDAPYLYIDGDSAIFVLITLCAVIPRENPTEYCELRKLLFSVLYQFTPVSFSLVVDDDKVNGLVKRFNELDSVQREFLQLVLEKDEAKTLSCKSYNNTIRYQLSKHIKGFQLDDYYKYNRIVIYNFDHSDDETYEVKPLSEHSSPLATLAALLYAKKEGILKTAHLAFKSKGSNALLSEQALSDGEYLWLARLGLILLSRYEDNLLFMFDEPDVHLNESWNINFVKLLNLFGKRRDYVSTHDYIIATHSSLILTDVTSDQLYHFFKNDQGLSCIRTDSISPFAASREEISKQIFGTPEAIGTFSKEIIEKGYESNNFEQVSKLVYQMGPGVARLQMRDKLYDLMMQVTEEKKDQDAT